LFNEVIPMPISTTPTPMPAVCSQGTAATPRAREGREITLLPRHWQWLAQQPRSASATLRLLVEEARHDRDGRQRLRAAQEACYQFMRAEAGDRPGFEDAVRALFAGDAWVFAALVAHWPVEVRHPVRALASPVWEAAASRVAP
jgi:uncharacterized protein